MRSKARGSWARAWPKSFGRDANRWGGGSSHASKGSRCRSRRPRADRVVGVSRAVGGLPASVLHRRAGRHAVSHSNCGRSNRPRRLRLTGGLEREHRNSHRGLQAGRASHRPFRPRSLVRAGPCGIVLASLVRGGQSGRLQRRCRVGVSQNTRSGDSIRRSGARPGCLEGSCHCGDAPGCIWIGNWDGKFSRPRADSPRHVLRCRRNSSIEFSRACC